VTIGGLLHFCDNSDEKSLYSLCGRRLDLILEIPKEKVEEWAKCKSCEKAIKNGKSKVYRYQIGLSCGHFQKVESDTRVQNIGTFFSCDICKDAYYLCRSSKVLNSE
jgi:hypothetical protein